MVKPRYLGILCALLATGAAQPSLAQGLRIDRLGTSAARSDSDPSPVEQGAPPANKATIDQLETYLNPATITGTGAARFRLSSTTVPGNPLLNGSQGASSYSINLAATLAEAAGSPFTQAEKDQQGKNRAIRHGDRHAPTGTGSALAPGFVVATNGDDNNPGTLAQPFATPKRCQSAMQGSSEKICYIRAGTYNVNCVPTRGTGCFYIT
ncbi:MAG: hypothetical protein JO095_11035, partial [Alphaproteobacteria bacterium]|nr:hypothetical protein [Alphaproteobacteria bacterium]